MLCGAGDLATKEKMIRPIIKRIGGKTKLAEKIIKLFPPDEYVKTYVELFVGGGSIFFKKKEAKINIINDLDKDIFNIYNDIKKVDNIDDFEFSNNREKFDKLLISEFKKPRDRLYRNLYISKNSFMGNRKSFGADYGHSDTSRIGIMIKKNYTKYREKLLKTNILNKDYKEVIKKYNKYDTLFYLDPPYSAQKASWGYNEGNDITPNQLLKTLKTIKGYFLMSYDYSPELKQMFEKDFIVKVVNTKYETKTSSNPVKELVIMNYTVK
jgi:DNA adenine methylase